MLTERRGTNLSSSLSHKDKDMSIEGREVILSSSQRHNGRGMLIEGRRVNLISFTKSQIYRHANKGMGS